MAAGAGATGLRAWLIARTPAWLTARGRTVLTRGLLGAGIAGAALVGRSPG